MPPLTHSQVQNLLEKAQSLPSKEASSIISSLPQRTKPHPSLTPPLLELLQIHPYETLPHISNLLPENATDQLLETLSSLLSSDRRLLPPILGLLPSIPLSKEQLLQTRATIAYALDIVDRDDIPTVVRTLSTMQNAWSADTLRNRLRLTPDIVPVVAEALSHILSRKNHLSDQLLSPSPPPRTLDILLLIQASQSPLFRQARQSLTTLTRSGAFSRCSYPKTVACLSTSLPTYVHGTARMLTTLLSAARPEAGEIAAIAKFCKSVIEACPPAADGISVAHGFVASRVHTFLLSSLDNPRLRPHTLHHVPEIAVSALQHTVSPNWAPLLISVRKGALFGTREDYRRVAGLSRCVVQQANEDIVTELFEILDMCVGDSLAVPLAVVLLDLLGDALMRGTFIEDIFRKRVAKLPEGLLRRVRKNGGEIVKVDIGIIWEQRTNTVANVVSSAVAMMLADRGTEGIARGLLEVSVMVPPVCIRPYKAVEDISEPIPLSSKSRRRSHVLDIVPAQLSDLKSSELSMAILSFAAGMATIVGLLNRASRWQGICRRIVEKRHEAIVAEEDRKSMLIILDRLTDFDRMRSALALATEVLQRQWNDLRTPQKGAERSRKRKREAVRAALERAQTVRDSVVASLDGEEGARRQGPESKEHDFPKLSLEAIILSLVSLPDEEGIESIHDELVCKQTRDVELVRLDKLLLLQLLRLMTPSIKSVGLTGDSKEHVPALSNIRNVKAVDWVDHFIFGKDSVPPVRIDDVIPNFEKLLQEKDDSFFNEDNFSDDEALEEDEETSTVLWAPNNNNEHMDKAYVQSTVSLLLGSGGKFEGCEGSPNLASVVHSPAFAALLLDRAATYVAVARKARSSECDETFLSEIVMASGLALGCLNFILRIVPMLLGSDEVIDSVRSAAETEKMSCDFLNELGKRLLVGVPPRDNSQKNPGIISKHLNQEGWKVITTLRWIALTSVEATVASAAIEGILTMSEFDVCHKKYARQLAFSSLTIVYEYEGEALWENNELDLVLRDSYSEWSLRRRISQERQEEGVDQLDTPDPHPWINIKLKKLRRKLLERQRLSLYFSGMYVPDALIEACGWIREMSVALSAGAIWRKEDSTTELSTRGTFQKANGHRKSQKRRRVEPKGLVRKEVLTCDILVDMTGFRTITELVMDIVIQGLQAYPVSTSLSVEDTKDDWRNPVPHLHTSLRLFCGLVYLFHENRQKLISASRDITSNISLDPEFDYSMVTGYIAVLQITRLRIDEIFAWYSNPGTDVSQLSSETMTCLTEIVGCSSQAVNRCSAVVESIKGDQGSESDDDSTGNRRMKGKKGRKTPGYVKRKRTEDEDVPKARRMIPRLTGQCANVVKSLQKLAKTVGIRARQNWSGLSAQAISRDKSLHFGIGLQQGNDNAEDDNAEEDDSEAGRSKTTAGMSSDNGGMDTGMEIEGFHVRSDKTDNQTPVDETVVVNFGRGG